MPRPLRVSRLLLAMSLTSGSLAFGAFPEDSAAQEPSDAARRPVVGRSVVATRYGVVATSQPLASQAAVEVLERGGNAIDAAIAANAVVGVMEPTGNGVGGDLFVLVHHAASGRVYGLNASGWSPAGQSAERLRARGDTVMPYRGIEAVTVPGVVAGWDALRERFGTLPFETLLAPAIHYAEEGFPVTEVVAGLWPRSREMLAAHPSSRATFLVDGERAPRAGEVWRNPDLAGTLRRIASEGRAGFYEGPTAEAILAVSREQGGTMAAADLAEFRAEWVEPVSTTYRGWRVWEIPPNTQGIAALMMLNLMERFPLGEWGLHDPRALHAMIEAKKLAYADMLSHVGDPRFADVPVGPMLDREHAARRAAGIDMARAACSVDPSRFAGITDVPGSETIYLAAADAEGNVVSLIQSNYSGFGSGLVPPGTGFMLQNRGALFTLEPGRPNTLEPRKRPLHTIIPGMMARDGTTIGFGIMGGWNQAQAHAQFVSHVVDHGLNLQEALEAGRFTKPTFEGCDVMVEELVPAETREALRALGHEVEVVPPRSFHFGFGQAVMTTPDDVRFGASDPRHDGAAIPQPAPYFDR